MLSGLERAALAGTRTLSIIGLVALMGLATMTLADGLMRWLANQPIQGVRDLGALTIAVAVSCSLPMVLIERGNITIRAVDTMVSPALGRICNVFAALLVGVMVFAMAWQFYLYAEKMTRAHETTWVLHIPVAPFWYGVDAILWCAVLVQAIVAAREIARVIEPDDPGIDPGADPGANIGAGTTP
jgi:TRAP-type C4-dicarboxylate transport system permease small subunit